MGARVTRIREVCEQLAKTNHVTAQQINCDARSPHNQAIVIRRQFYAAGINSIVELADNRGAALNQGFTRADIRTAAQT